MDSSNQAIGMITIGQAPRDDVVPAMRPYLPSGVSIVQYGALDGLTYDQAQRFAVRRGEVGIVTRLRDVSSILLSHDLIIPAMQEKVDLAVERDGAALTVILCGADWSALQSERLIVNPGTLFPAVISSLAAKRRLGVIKPSAGQVDKERARYAGPGIDAVVTAASPYGGAKRLELAREAAETLADADCGLIWMTCVGMDAPMRDIVTEVTGKPVVLAHALLARIVSELLGAPVRAGAPA